MRALDGEPRPEPGDDDDEDPGQQDLGRVERGLRQRDANARAAHLLGAAPVAGEEDLLAADPAQDAQARDRVGAEGGQPADLLALLALPRLQRPDHEREAQHEHGHAEQHDEPEHERRREQDDRDDEVGGDRARRGAR